MNETKFRMKVHDIAGHVCQLRFERCTGTSTVAHHILMRSQGGQHDPDNGLALCNNCHDYVHAHRADAYREGWIRRNQPRPGDFHYEENE